MIKVMVAEDNLNLNYAYCNFLTKDKNIEIVSRTSDGENTIKEYFKYQPDILLLDLDLPKYNGLEVINYLSLTQVERTKCNIIVITGNHDLKHKIYDTSKIYKIFNKPIDLNYILFTINDMTKYNTDVLSQDNLQKLLSELGFKLYSEGTQYLMDAINIAYSNTSLLYKLNLLYVEVSKINNQPSKRIQRSIRNSIDVMNKHISKDLLCSFFGITNNDIVTPRLLFTTIIDFYTLKN